MKNKKTKTLAKKIIATLFLLVVLILFTVIYILPNVSDAFKQTDIAEYGIIQAKEEVTCYIVRDEVIYYANNSGTVERYVEEGDQVRKGTKIMDLLPMGASYYADQRGVISFFIDGLESVLNSSTMQSLKKKTMDELVISEIKPIADQVEAGQPIYKIVNNDVWHILFWIDKESILNYEKNKEILLELPSKDSIKGTIKDIIADENYFLIIAEFNQYFDAMPSTRMLKTEVVTSDYKGLAIRNESITSIDGQAGVYVRNLSGEFVFKPIKVITSDGIFSLVECGYYYNNNPNGNERIATVDIYDEILRNAN